MARLLHVPSHSLRNYGNENIGDLSHSCPENYAGQLNTKHPAKCTTRVISADKPEIPEYLREADELIAEIIKC